MVCEELAADVEAADGGVEGAALEDGGDGGVGVARVDEEDGFGGDGGGKGGAGGGRRGAEGGLDVVVGVEGGAWEEGVSEARTRWVGGGEPGTRQ